MAIPGGGGSRTRPQATTPQSQDYRRLDASRGRTYVCPMPELDVQLLQRWLSLAALFAGTAQYAGLLRRREDRRRWTAWKAEADRSGLQGLVRLFAADN